MSDGTTGGAVPGAAELAAIRARNREFMAWWFERDPPYIPSVTTPYYEAMRDIAALLALVDTLTGALAEAERDRAADAAVLAALVEDPWVGFHADSLEEHYCCFYCTATVSIGNDAEPTVLPDHDDDCPLARARGILDARRAATTTGEDADGADAGDTGTRAGR